MRIPEIMFWRDYHKKLRAEGITPRMQMFRCIELMEENIDADKPFFEKLIADLKEYDRHMMTGEPYKTGRTTRSLNAVYLDLYCSCSYEEKRISKEIMDRAKYTMDRSGHTFIDGREVPHDEAVKILAQDPAHDTTRLLNYLIVELSDVSSRMSFENIGWEEV